jgi:malonyl-CoA/methylmalonyl-CoA synthetase
VLEARSSACRTPTSAKACVGVIVPEKGHTVSEEAIMASIKDQVARFKQPKKIYVLDELPRNTMGKVQKNILREQYQSTFSA